MDSATSCLLPPAIEILGQREIQRHARIKDGVVDVSLLEYHLREDLNARAARAMAVLRPLRVVIENFSPRVMDNLGAVLAAANSSFDQVMKSTIYLVDMADFPAVNAVFGEYFPGDINPARATVAVLALPRGSRVEIDMIALG